MILRTTQARLALISLQLFVSFALPGSAAVRHAPAGRYPVGVITFQLADESRTDHLTGRHRELVTEVWYPASDAAKSLPPAKLSDFIPGGFTPEIEKLMLSRGSIGSAAEVEKRYTMLSHRDAPIRNGKYPIIVFSHGNGGFRFQNTFWCDYLASHGYIIISADHTGNAGVTVLKEGIVPMKASEMLNSSNDRVKDVSFLLDEVIRWNKDASSRFHNHVDLSYPIASGMSFGSMTAVKVGDKDPRFKAVIAMSGAYPEHTNLSIPTLWMIGTEDRTIGTAGNTIVRNHHSKQAGPSFMLELKNGGHYSFTDVGKMASNFGDGVGKGKRRDTGVEFEFTDTETTYDIINYYSLHFLEHFVRHKHEMQELTANFWPEELIWSVRNFGPEPAAN